MYMMHVMITRTYDDLNTAHVPNIPIGTKRFERNIPKLNVYS